MKALNPSILSRAIVLFLGYGVAPYPEEQPKRLIDEFGMELTALVEPHINLILDELSQLKPEWIKHPQDIPGEWAVHALDSAGSWAMEEMHERHPELNQEALNALKWVFMWWWR